MSLGIDEKIKLDKIIEDFALRQLDKSFYGTVCISKTLKHGRVHLMNYSMPHYCRWICFERKMGLCFGVEYRAIEPKKM